MTLQREIWNRSLMAVAGLGVLSVVGCTAMSDSPKMSAIEPQPAAKEVLVTGGATAVARGEYLVRICGCNDCHTPGYSQTGGKVPVEQWLTGMPVGSRGPWGTTYASNLRIYVDPLSEDDWVRITRARNDKPPMPWEALHAMSDSDLRAIHHYIKSLGKTGQPMPEALPPGVEPKTPFLVFAPPSMPAGMNGK